MSRLPTILLFGNCQCEALADALRRVPPIIERFHIAYLPSFDIEQGNPARRLAAHDATRIAVLLEQIEATGPTPSWLTDWLPPAAPRFTFAPLDTNLLWPFQVEDPRNRPEPDFPFGRYPYGDRLVLDLLAEGHSHTTAFYAYLAESPARLPNLDRLAALDERRLIAREHAATVRIADVIQAEWRARRLFWTCNHPTGWLLAQLAARVLDAMRQALALPPEATAPGRGWDSYEPLKRVQVPLNPDASQRLGLTWSPINARTTCSDGTEVTFFDYLRRYIAFTGCV